MGNEVRRVPPNWEHPTYGEALKDRESIYYCRAASTRGPEYSYIPLYDQEYHKAAAEWIANFIEWHVRGNKECSYSDYYWEYSSPPEEDYCRLYKDEEATWFQVYETVSEGTPVSPPFATQDEFIDYLVKHGDFWRCHFNEPLPSRAACERLVKGGVSAPSMIVEVKNSGVNIKCGINSLEAPND